MNPYEDVCDRGYDVMNSLDTVIFLALGEGVEEVIHQALSSARNEIELAIRVAEDYKRRWKPED